MAGRQSCRVSSTAKKPNLDGIVYAHHPAGGKFSCALLSLLPYCSAPQAYIPHSRKIRETRRLPVKPKLCRCSQSARHSNPIKLATEMKSAPRMFGSVPVGERRSEMTTVWIGSAKMKWGGCGARSDVIRIGTARQ